MSTDERLHLAKLILNDLSPEENPSHEIVSMHPREIQDLDQLEGLLLAGLDSGAGIEGTPEYWDNKRRDLLDRYAQRAQKARNIDAIFTDAEA